MAQYAAHEAGTRRHSMPFGYDPTWLAQQQTQVQSGSSGSSAFPFTAQQQHPQQQDPQHRLHDEAGASILNHNDNSLLGDFFSNPDTTTNQMNFDFDFTAHGGDGEHNQASTVEDMFDLSGYGEAAGGGSTAFGMQHATHGDDYLAQSFLNSGGSQQRGVDDQMAGIRGRHEQDAEGEDGEDVKAGAQGLVVMSGNTGRHNPLNPEQLMLRNVTNGLGGGWSDMNPFSPQLSTQVPHLTGGRRVPGLNSHNSFGQNHGQGFEGPFGYYDVNNLLQQMQLPGLFLGMHQQALGNHPRSRHMSLANIHTGGLEHLPHTGPMSAQLPSGNLINFDHSDVNSRANYRYGSDEGFGPNGYLPPSTYNSPNEKAANLNHVPMAEEASKRASSHPGPHPMMPPGRTFRAQAQSLQSRGLNSPILRPSTPSSHNSNQDFGGGLRTTPNDTVMSRAAPHSGAGRFHQHGHPASKTFHASQFNREAPQNDQLQALEGQDDEDAHSKAEESESDSNPAPSQPARKRRKSGYEKKNEDDYEPPSSSNDRMNNVFDGSSDDDDNVSTINTGKGKKRARTAVPGSSNSSPSTPTARTPHLGGSNSTSARGRQSTTHNVRTPLTDEQRRQNHIKSEKNRRDLIKTNYGELNTLVPALKGGKSGLSKAEILSEIVEYVEDLEAGNVLVEKLLQSWSSRNNHEATLSTAQQYGPPSGYGGDDSSNGNPYSASNNPYSTGSDNDSPFGSNGGFDGVRDQIFNRYNGMVAAHAIMATAAFGFIFPVGGILIRLASFPGLWFIHGLVQLLAYFMYMAAFALGLYMVSHARGLIHNTHPILGIVIFALLVFQPVLGFVHHLAFKKYSRRTVWSYAHLWVGRVVITLGIINGGLGLQLSQRTRIFVPTQSAIIGYSVVAGLMWLIYVASAIYGEKKRSRQGAATAEVAPPPKYSRRKHGRDSERKRPMTYA